MGTTVTAKKKDFPDLVDEVKASPEALFQITRSNMITVILSCNDCGKFAEIPTSSSYQEQIGGGDVSYFGVDKLRCPTGWNYALGTRCKACNDRWVEMMKPVWTAEAKAREDAVKKKYRDLFATDRKALVAELKESFRCLNDTEKHVKMAALLECLEAM